MMETKRESEQVGKSVDRVPEANMQIIIDALAEDGYSVITPNGEILGIDKAKGV